MKTPKLSYSPSYINESSLGVSMEDMPKRGPRENMQSGDVIRMTDGRVLRVISREGKRQNYIRYRLDECPWIELVLSVSAFWKLTRGAEIINSWRCTYCHAPSHEPAPDERVVCNGCGIIGCERGVPKQ